MNAYVFLSVQGQLAVPRAASETTRKAGLLEYVWLGVLLSSQASGGGAISNKEKGCSAGLNEPHQINHRAPSYRL